MKFEDVQRSLPNGFHDSVIRVINIDFVSVSILLRMDLHASVEGDRDPERYRPGTLKVFGPYFFFLEPPDAAYPFIPDGKPVNASGAPVNFGENPKLDALLKRIPEDSTTFVFFLDDWNTYLYIAGASVEFSWDD